MLFLEKSASLAPGYCNILHITEVYKVEGSVEMSSIGWIHEKQAVP